MKTPRNPAPFRYFDAQPHAIRTIRRLLHFVTLCYTYFFAHTLKSLQIARCGRARCPQRPANVQSTSNRPTPFERAHSSPISNFQFSITNYQSALLLFLFAFTAPAADWPTFHANPEHTGYSDEQLQFPLHLQWAVEFENDRFDTAAEPLITGSTISVTSQLGHTYRIDANGSLISSSHNPLTRPISPTDAPLRQNFASSDNRIYVTTEDLRLHCLDKQNNIIWTSDQMSGQTARDYYPVIVRAAGKKFVVVRTNPVLNMAQQIANDRNFLTRQAGIDASDWKKLDAWIKSPAADGTPDLIAREQDAIVHYLETNKWAQTFYVFDAETGKRAFTPPIMWVGGCQGVGTPPAITKEGKAVVLYRSAYGNWNHGVAPLVALGLLNFETGRIEPLRHNQGAQPPWNTFWGTADEAQNFTIANDDIIIVHQGTLSRFNLVTHNLEKIWGDRDTYGGFKNPSWARNEWHGPARGGVAISNGRLYWLTGSRLLCLGPEKRTKTPGVQTIVGRRASSQAAPGQRASSLTKKHLATAVTEALSKNWAPLYVEPGLAGREFFFADSRETFTALSYAYPHLSRSDRSKLKKHLTALFQSRPPFGTNAVASLKDGERREHFQVPPQALSRLGNDKAAHRFGGVYAAELYAERCNAWPEVLKSWPEIQSAFTDFTNKNPNFGQKPELYFNRYLSSLIAYEKIAARMQSLVMNSNIAERSTNSNFAAHAGSLTMTATPTLAQWWREADATLTNFNGSQQLDPFIQKGDKLSWAVFPHRHKLAIFQDMTPEIAEIIRREAPEAAAQVWSTFTNLAPTWHLQGEERQYHFGENFVDTPDFALSAFQALAFVQKAKTAELVDRVDIPFCKADLYHLQKLAIALEAAKMNQP
jgi:hypothetical protein